MLRALVLATILSSTALADNPSIFMVGDIGNTYTGTAFALQTKEGIITVTNAHVCKDQEALYALVHNELKVIVVTRVYDKHDLCMLTAVPGVPALSMGSSYTKGEYASTEGFPLHKHRITHGSLGGLFRFEKTKIDLDYLGEVESGSSGSPLLNRQGQVIGVIHIKYQYGRRWLGGAVPLEYLREFIGE